MTVNEEFGSMILVVEDEQSMAAGLEYNLVAEGYKVVRAADGQAALERCAEQEFDLVILDIMLPFLDGFEVAGALRKTNPRLPILMLTARVDFDDRVKGLELGADDYMTKPFHLPELLARVKGILRRKQWYNKALDEQPVYQFSDITIDFGDLSCRVKGQSFRLTPQEAMIMRYLVNNPNRIISRGELLEKVWHVVGAVETRTVDVFIVRLRKLFEPNPQVPVHIISVRGAGYRFVAQDGGVQD